jgi:transmembrane sensor
MTKYIATELLEKYIRGKCTEEEKAIVESWHLKELESKCFNAVPGQIENAYTQIWDNISKEASFKKTATLKEKYYKYAIAAILFITVSAGLFLFINGKNNHPTVNDLLVKTGKDFAPGGNKATLTLADGSTISLTDAANGNLAKQAGIVITKTKDGQIIYNVTKNTSLPAGNEQVLINTISTPRGGEYQVNLPDGSKVWLNSQSSLKYPVLFKGKERIVELSGEGYFEVAKKDMPFIVKTAIQEVKVLGTHFNINSYEDEPATKTTLLEGSVSVHTNTKSQSDNPQNDAIILKPGQGSIINNKSIKVISADTENVMAWKNNLFNFRDEPLESIMRKLSRWYDVEIQFEGKSSNLSFVGVVSRSKNISSVLKIMEEAGDFHFKVEGRKITIIN